VDDIDHSGRLSIHARTSEARHATRPGPRWRCRGNNPSAKYLYTEARESPVFIRTTLMLHSSSSIVCGVVR
jgi:hypothetical protein